MFHSSESVPFAAVAFLFALAVFVAVYVSGEMEALLSIIPTI
jgi:hypothetical protein